MTNTDDKVRDLLHEAGETHHIVFRLVDGVDDDWASWYSEWLIDHSELPEILGTRPVRSELTSIHDAGVTSDPPDVSEAPVRVGCPGSTPTCRQHRPGSRRCLAGSLSGGRSCRWCTWETAGLRLASTPARPCSRGSPQQVVDDDTPAQGVPAAFPSLRAPGRTINWWQAGCAVVDIHVDIGLCVHRIHEVRSTVAGQRADEIVAGGTGAPKSAGEPSGSGRPVSP